MFVCGCMCACHKLDDMSTVNVLVDGEALTLCVSSTIATAATVTKIGQRPAVDIVCLLRLTAS